MLTHIFLVRHAHSTYTQEELERPLSERGFQEAKQVTNILRQENIEIVVSSPYKRAVQTAQKRGVQALNELLDTYHGCNAAVGTHGNLMVLIMNYFDTRYDFSFWQRLNMPDIYKLSFHGATLQQVTRVWGR